MATPPKESKIQNAGVRYRNQIADLGMEAQADRETQERKTQNATLKNSLPLEHDEEERLLTLERTQQLQMARGTQLRTKHATGVVRRVGRFSIGVGLGIAITAYLWQFLFAFLSLAFLAGAQILTDTPVLGKALTWIIGFIGIDMSTPGFALWGLASFINIITFLCFFLWFKMLKINVLGTIMSMFVTLFALALSLLPVSNLFPWIVLWIIYVNINSLFSST